MSDPHNQDMASPQLTSELAWELACGGPFPDFRVLEGDSRYMALAIREAMKGVGLSSPNPSVGCVLERNGQILGKGVHTRAGDPHGEIMALRDAETQGYDVCGATAFVTLEPCCHHGRTPPCTDALIRAGVTRVVVGVRDSNPRVDGGGMAILQAHGIQIEEDVLKDECSRLHAPFFKLIKTGIPWVTLKLAIGSDGSIGLPDRTTQITSSEVQSKAHALRRASEAIVVGRHTIEIDDPELTDRWAAPIPPHRTFLRVILDSEGRLSQNRRIWASVQGQPVIRAVVGEPAPLRNVEDLRLPPGPGGCSLKHLLYELAARGVSRVLFEGGATLARQLLSQGLVDDFHRFVSVQPAGGPPLDLEMGRTPHVRSIIPFEGGRWEILTNLPSIP